MQLIFWVLLFLPAFAWAAPPFDGVGYQPRACGFDMNRNGVIGEAADCNVCDKVTLDPDGDGTNEDIFYVNSSTGVDNGTCGAPGSPCLTVGHVLSTRADGPGGGAEDIVCLEGTFQEELTLIQSGYNGVASGWYTRDNFRFPNNPTMIVGTDADNDGSYPPFDTDDTAVLTGNNGALRLAIQWDGPDYIEMAHIAVNGYGGLGGFEGFANPSSANALTEYVYFHDLDMVNINVDRPSLSNTIVFNFFGSHQHIAIINTQVDGYGSFWVRGADNNGPYRFQNNTTKMHGCDESVCGTTAAATAIKLWAEIDGVEVLNNIFDANVAAWTPVPSGGQPSNGVDMAQCSRDWTVRGNQFIDLKIAVVVQPYDGSPGSSCETRTVTNVVVDQNIIRNTYAPWAFGNIGIFIQPGRNVNATTEDLTFTNNFLSSSVPWDNCILSEAGNDGGVQPGTIRIAGNTCEGATTRSGMFFGIPAQPEPVFPQQNYVIQSNSIANMGGGGNIQIDTDYTVGNWIANGNTYDPGAGYLWQGAPHATLGTWQTASGQDANSRECVPQFVDGPNGDYHLLPIDTCAVSNGVDISAITTVDIDGDPRPVAITEAGADELAGKMFVDKNATGCTFPDATYDPVSRACGSGIDTVYNTLDSAEAAATPGSTVFLRWLSAADDWIFTPTANNQTFWLINTSGTVGNYIVFRGYQNERPRIYCQETTGYEPGRSHTYCYEDRDANPGVGVPGDADGPNFDNGTIIHIQASYVVLQQIETFGSNDQNIKIEGSGAPATSVIVRDVISNASWFAGVFVRNAEAPIIEDSQFYYMRHFPAIYYSGQSGEEANNGIIRRNIMDCGGFEDDCTTKVLPIPGDPSGGGNVDCIKLANTCRNTMPNGQNACDNTIVQDNVFRRCVDGGLDDNAWRTLLLRNIAIDNGHPAVGSICSKQLNDSNNKVQGAQYVQNMCCADEGDGLNPSATGSTFGLTLHRNTVVGNGARGIIYAGNQPLNAYANLTFNNTGRDWQNGCTGGDDCGLNWIGDNQGPTTPGLTGDPQVVNAARCTQPFTPPAGPPSAIVAYYQDEMRTAFSPAPGSPLIGAGTPLTYVNPQTSATVQIPCIDDCDIGAYEFEPIRTYPGAEGYGAITQGPRAGDGNYVVRHVTTLNYSGAGSIQAALETDPGGAGVYVVFEVSGYINVPQGATLQAAYPNTYIAGHTAPGGGVCLRLDPAATTEAVLMSVSASEYIIRGLCFRHGADPSATNDAPGLRIGPNVSQILVDRITNDFSAAEHVDVSANVNGDVRNVTIQRSAFINSLEPNSNSMLINDDTGQSQTIIGMSIVRNFFAHSRARVPRVTSRNSAGVEVINNAIYGTNESSGSVYSSITDIIGNLLLASPGFPSLQWETDPGFGGRPWYNDLANAPSPPSTYMDGNIVEYKSGNTANDNNGTFAVVRDLATVGQPIPGTWQRGTRLATPAAFPVTITDANTAWATIVTQQNVGAVYRLTETGALVRRPVDTGLEKALIDARDKRPQVDLTRETYVSDPADVGGFPVIATGTPYADVDRDGMADVWETANGLNPADPADAFLTTLQAPYLNIDVFLFGVEAAVTGAATLRNGARISNGAILR